MTKEEIIDALKTAVAEGDMDGAKAFAERAVEAQVPVSVAIQDGAVEGMKISGQKYEQKEYFVADLIVSAEAMKSALSVLEPLLKAEKAGVTAKVILGTVQGDVHDIGKNLVATMLRGAGFEVYDLGINVSAQKFVEKVKETQADIVGASAYTSTSIYYQRDVLTELKKSGLKDRVLYMVGGAPTNAEWAQSIGADGWAGDAWQAVQVATELMERKKPASL
jgi:methylmalonyl-CoA mutase cobalamin-binding domain/chain